MDHMALAEFYTIQRNGEKGGGGGFPEYSGTLMSNSWTANLPAAFQVLCDPGELVVCFFLVKRSMWLVVKVIIASVSTQQYGVNHQDLDHAPSCDVVCQGVEVVWKSPVMIRFFTFYISYFVTRTMFIRRIHYTKN